MNNLINKVYELIGGLNDAYKTFYETQASADNAYRVTQNHINGYDSVHKYILGVLQTASKSCAKFEKDISNTIAKNYLKKPILQYATIKDVNITNFSKFLYVILTELKSSMKYIATCRENELENHLTHYANAKIGLDYVLNDFDNLMQKHLNKDLINQMVTQEFGNGVNAREAQYIDTAVNYINQIYETYDTIAEKENKARTNFDKELDENQLHEDRSVDAFSQKILIGISKTTGFALPPKPDLVGDSNKIIGEIESMYNALNNLQFNNEINSCEYIDLKELISQRSSITIRHACQSLEEQEKFDDFLNSFVLQLINKMPSKMARIAYVDGGLSKLGQLIMHIKTQLGPSSVFDGVINSNEKINNLLDNLNTLVLERNEALGFGPNAMSDVFEYNSKVDDNKQPFIFFIINDFPKNLSREQLDKIKNIITNGSKAGIFTIIINNANEKIDEYMYSAGQKVAERLLDSAIYQLLFIDDRAIFNSYDIEIKIKPDNFDVENQLKHLQSNIKNQDTKIYLDTILDKPGYLENRPNPYQKLQIPIGKSGSQIYYLNLSADSDCHMIITGVTGSGKSYLLHTLILSACYNYSPDEVNFYLMDFKDGVEFNSYNKEMAMPHIKYMALGSRPEEALDILKSLVAKKEKINELFTSLSENGRIVNNIETYNNHPNVIAGKLPKVPHTFIVIDEFQVIVDQTNSSGEECLNLLRILAEQSRNVGFHLVFSSQKIPSGGFRNVLQQVNTRICLNGHAETIQDLIPEARNRIADLTTDKGLGFISQNHQVVLYKGAVAEAESIDKSSHSRFAIYNKIMQKYSNYPINILSSGNIESIPFKNYADILVEQGENSYSACIGKNMITDENYILEFKMLESVSKGFIQIGNLQKSKQVEAILIANILNKNKDIKTKADISYLNFRTPSSAKINDIALNFAQENNVEILENIADIRDKLTKVQDTFKQRKNNYDSDFEYSPIFVFISSAERVNDIMKEANNSGFDTQTNEMGFINSFSSQLSFGGEEFDLLSLMLEGYKYSIFIIPSFASIESYRMLTGNINKTLPIKMLLLDDTFSDKKLDFDEFSRMPKIRYGGDVGLIVDKNQISKIRLYKKEI